VDHDRGVRQPFLDLVVVGDDQLQAQPAGLLRLGQAADPAIDRNHHRRPRLGDLPQGFGVEPVALLQAVRHVEVGLAPQQAQGLPEDSRPREAVHVIVAVHAHPPAGPEGVVEAAGGLREPGQQGRLVQALEGCSQEAPRPFHLPQAPV
jgi:hypothetical protein